LGVLLDMLRLAFAPDELILDSTAAAIEIVGLIVFRHRLRGIETAVLRRIAAASAGLLMLRTISQCVEYVPGYEPPTWFTTLWFAAILLMTVLHLGLARRCTHWKLDDLATAWRAAAFGWVLLAIFAGIAPARTLFAPDWRPQWGSGEALLFLSLCFVVIPCILFLAAAIRTRLAERRMRGGCVKCGFDLRGLRDPVCPECGTPFAASRARLAVPLRRRSMPFACPLVVVAIAATVTATLWQLPGSAVKRKPLWLVNRDALRLVAPGHRRGVDRRWDWSPSIMLDGESRYTTYEGFGAKEAQEELLVRIAAGGLSADVGERLADRVLAAQADLTRPFGRLGDVFAELAAAGLVRADQRTLFLRQALAFSLRVRPRIRQEAIVPFAIDATWRGLSQPAPWGPSLADVGVVRLEVTEVLIGGESQRPLPEPTTYSQGNGSGGYSWFGRHGHERPEQMPKLNAPLGDQDVRVRFRASIAPELGAAASGAGALDGWPSDQEYRLAGHTSVVTAADSTVRALDDPKSYRERTQGMSASILVLRGGGSVWVSGGNAASAAHRNRAAAFEIFMRVDGEEHPVGQTVIGWQFGTVSFPKVPSPLMDQILLDQRLVVTLVLRPSVEAAESTIDIDEIVVGPPIELDAEVRSAGSRGTWPPAGK
jgi:hypothetical protein